MLTNIEKKFRRIIAENIMNFAETEKVELNQKQDSISGNKG